MVSLVKGFRYLNICSTFYYYEAISKMPEEYGNTCELDQSEKHFGVIFPSCLDASSILQPSKKAFDFPPSFVAS
jgi:hypothetical protein